MKKRICALALLLCAVTAFSACSGANSGVSSATSATSKESSVWYPSGKEPKSSDDISDSEQYSGQSSDKSDTLTGEVPTEWQDGGIFSANYEKAYNIVLNMSLDEKIGQMFYARCPDSGAVEDAQGYHLGGYVIFGEFFKNKTKQEVADDISNIRNANTIPLTVSVDEEGGTVTRISAKPLLSDHEFQSPRDLYTEGGIELIKSDAEEKAKLLCSLGVDTNLAPVCDICENEDDFMYDRSIGLDAEGTGEFVSEVTKISQQNGVSVTLKHFPGYGSNVDTHTGIAVDDRSYEEFESKDFLPFKSGIEAGAHAVLVSHNIVNCMDSTRPASISAPVHKQLREELGFTGVIFTDDLAMDAISEYTSDSSPVVEAVLAGNDMILISDIAESLSDVRAAVEDGRIDEKIIDHAVMRVLAWKLTTGVLK